MKEITQSKRFGDMYQYRIGEAARVQTDDGMAYIFKKPAWEDKWLFSHRATNERGSSNVDSSNYSLPNKVEEWADENLGEWGYANGTVTYKGTVGRFSFIVQRDLE